MEPQRAERRLASRYVSSRKEEMVKALFKGKTKRRGKSGEERMVHVGVRNRPNSHAKSITLFAAEFLHRYIINYSSTEEVWRDRHFHHGIK